MAKGLFARLEAVSPVFLHIISSVSEEVVCPDHGHRPR